MQQSPWRMYFGQMQKSSLPKQSGRHPVIGALSVIGVITITTAAFFLRFNRWYYGEISVLPLCDDRRYNFTVGHAIVPINEPLAYCLSLAVPPAIILCIEFLYFVVSLDNDDGSDGDDTKPRAVAMIYLLFFRFLHFVAVLFLTAAFVSVTVDVIKIVFDWPRPYFLREFPFNCDPTNVEQNPKRILSPEEINARLGFPSHRVALLSSSAVLLNAQSMHVCRAMRSSDPFEALVVLAGALATLFAAASILTSRENRLEDVVVGLLIGVVSAAYMTSTLPTILVWSESETKTSKSTTTTIEELNSFAPMRQGLPVPYKVHRSLVVRCNPPTTNERINLSGFTSQGDGLVRIN